MVEDDYVMVCGGVVENDPQAKCEVIKGNSDVNEVIEIDSGRIGSAIQWSDNSLWLTGHTNDKSTIIVSRSGYVKGPDLPEIRYGHCALRINLTTAIIASGMIKKEPFETHGSFGNKGQSSKSSWYFDFPSQTWIEGPEMFDSRVGQLACTMVTIDGQQMVALSNGKHKQYVDG